MTRKPAITRQRFDRVLAERRAQREQMLVTLHAVSEDGSSILTGIERWTEVRWLLLRFGDHMREHVSQIEGVRPEIGRPPKWRSAYWRNQNGHGAGLDRRSH